MARRTTHGQGQQLSSPWHRLQFGRIPSTSDSESSSSGATGGDISSTLESTPQGTTLKTVVYGCCN